MSDNSALFTEFISKERLDRTEGEGAVRCLNEIAKLMGYDDTGFKFGDSLGNFLQDNPGCVEAIHEWIAENISDDQIEMMGIGEAVEDEEA